MYAYGCPRTCACAQVALKHYLSCDDDNDNKENDENYFYYYYYYYYYYSASACGGPRTPSL